MPPDADPTRLTLHGRTVVVAGAGGGGIGTAIARLLAQAGALVVALDIDADRLAIAEREIEVVGGRGESMIVDVRDADAVTDAIDRAAALGSLYGLVHVAGGMFPGQWAPLISLDPDAFDQVMQLNLRAAFLTTRAVGAHLAEAGTGSIVHIASIVGITAMPFGGAYAAAKAGLLALTRTAALELGPSGVRVNAVAVGTVRTPKNEDTNPPEDTEAERVAIPIRRRGRPIDIAGAVLYLLSDLAGFVTGHTLVVDGGSSTRPSLLDADNLPVFVHDNELRAHLLED